MSRTVACAALIAAGGTAALLSIGAAGIALVPPDSTSILGDLLHIEIPALPRTVTPERFVAVFVGSTLGVGFLAAFVAWLGTGLLHRLEIHPVADR